MLLPLSSIAGIFIPVAHAVVLEQRGRGAAGVNAMWQAICGVFGHTCGLGVGAVPFFAQRVIDFVFPAVGTIAVMLVIYAGIRIIIARGQEDGLSEAKKIISHALVGVALAMLSGAIVAFGALFVVNIFA